MISLKINFLAIVITIIFTFIIILFLFRDYRFRRQFLLKVLRVILVFIILVLIFNLEYQQTQITGKLDIYMLIDNSYSMKFNNRLEKVKQFLERNYEELSKKNNIHLYSFNTDLHEVQRLSYIDVTHSGTNINGVINKFLYSLKKPFVAFLFTDGINATNELPNFKNDYGYLVPISFRENGFKDISLVDIKYSKIGFKNLEHEINLTIASYGYNNESVNVKLIDYNTKGTIINDNVLVNEGKNNFKLKFIPKNIGKHKFMVELKKLQGEISYENNQGIIDIEVKKDKIRVLYICGQPSPEYYHLRNLLKNEPSVDLVSFVILRNPESIAIVPDEDSALIPFPIYDIFVKELFNYDLVIFENFSYKRFGIPLQYLENLRQFVLNGGGFIMIGGPNSFFLGGYKYTPIEDLLPVIISEDEEWIYSEYRPDLVNVKDALVNILDDEKENILMWKTSPFLGNYQKVSGVKENAVCLLKYNDSPIMCYTNKGKGRVFVSLTNTTWRWSLGNLISEKYDYRNMYTKFWKNVIYFTSGAEEMKNLYIVCADRYNLEDQIDISVISNLKEILAPNLYVTYPNKYREFLNIKKISDSRYLASFKPNIEGKYLISVSAKKGRSVFKDEKEIYVGEILPKEISILKVDNNYLKNLSELYGTDVEYIDNVNLSELIEKFKNKFNQKYINIIAFYRTPVLGMIFIILFLLEIFIARFK